ncbi:MAG: AAA family ATPase, partial [Caulobacterales bacterium]|nr:AAA family ATPase [Caulobacterales bacterium]
GAARLAADLARRHDLPAFDPGAVARLIENASRRAHASDRISVHGGQLLEVMTEAAHRARTGGATTVARAHVEETIQAQKRRLDRAPERLREEIAKGSIVVDVDGAKVGQINGLSVSELGRLRFGRPARITATARLGAGKVVDIERETDLGGPLHSKGVLILQRFLASRYAPDTPLSMSASIVFEQSYGRIDGDSASSAELYALISTLAGAPIEQGIAVTGSVNQRGEVQSIGGVNEKIEGFFDVCRAEGLTGRQGVMIPVANVRHLMLRADVREAAEAGRFHIYAVATIDEGLEILTGLPAGERDAQGRFPDASVNGRAEARLVALAHAARDFARKRTDKESDDGEDEEAPSA